MQKSPYSGSYIKETNDNAFFRKVLFTGAKSQLVAMNIKPGEDIGEETHHHVEQTLFLLSGEGKAVLEGKEQPYRAGDVVVVTPGTKHNFVNTGGEPLKIFTIYAPANHIEGRIHRTKHDAEMDEEDEAFGDKVE
jgi:mannose-6-phosphate isomerase-like protein (cupin superfamily)